MRDGDLIRVDARRRPLEALVDAAEWQAREVATLAPDAAPSNGHGIGRELFAGMRKQRPLGRGGRLHMAVVDPGGLLEPLDLAAFGPVIPVIVIDQAEQAVPMARALVDGGVRVLEVTLRTAGGAGARSRRSPATVPEAIVGAGTLRSAADARSAQAAGARFGVSPGYSAAVAEACRELGLPLLPGVATASEVMHAADDGFRFLKFFPASAAGGPALLKAWASPFADIAFCPTGGIGIDSAPGWLALPNVKVVGGSWLTPAEALAAGDWARITELAREASALRKA